MRAARVLLAVLVLCACEPDVEPTPRARPEPVAPPESPGPASAPRGPRGAGPVECHGASDDPPQIDLFSQSADQGQVDQAIAGLQALAGAHPASATARVRLGQLALRTQPPGLESARGWFERALELHEQGCTLEPREHWLALEGSALSRMMSGDYAGALPFLRTSVERWPGASGTRYNLACALCQTGDVDGCARELRRAISGTEELPELLQEQRRTPDQYREMARADPDLAPLRADAARFEEAIR